MLIQQTELLLETIQKSYFIESRSYQIQKTVIAIEGSSKNKSGLSIFRSIFNVSLDVEVKSAKTPRSLSVISFFKPADDIYTECYLQEVTLQYNSSLPANDTSVPMLKKNGTTSELRKQSSLHQNLQKDRFCIWLSSFLLSCRQQMLRMLQMLTALDPPATIPNLIMFRPLLM